MRERWCDWVWETRKGVKIPLHKMTDDHVERALMFLEKHLPKHQGLLGWTSVLRVEKIRRGL